MKLAVAIFAWSRTSLRLARCVVVALPLAGCERRAAPRPTSPTPATLEPESLPSARRPARRYYVSHLETGCEVYYVDPTHVSAPDRIPCPPNLAVGERIRIAGKTCVREGDDPARVEPVVCPDPLTNLERRERGELPHKEDGG